MQERRRHPRLDVNLPVILRHRGRLLPATMLNLSVGGAYIRTDDGRVSEDGPVEVIFDIDANTRDISLRGTILRNSPLSDSSGLGIQFTNLFSESHRAVEEFLRRNLN